jgi:CDP-6-deoxy-D-xylo-4-hexulose-3-dehydrase
MIPLMKNAFSNEKETCNKLAEFLKKAPMGSYCEEFEKEFSQWQGRKYSILVNSGGSANFLLMQVLKNIGKIKKGDNIGFSSLTWATNVMPIIQHGMNPIPIDCDINTLNVMSKSLEEAIFKYNLKAFFATNVLGFSGDLEKIRSICDRYGILFIEDNCEALGTILTSNGAGGGGSKTGNFGVASTFSFFVAHHMSTIEGGMICTDDDEIAMNLIMSRANGWDRNLPKIAQEIMRNKYKIESEFKSKYTFYDIGMNVRPTEITGFLGCEQMNTLNDNLVIRDRNFKEINEMIKNNKELMNICLDYLSFIPAFSIPIIVKYHDLKEKYFNRFKDKVEIRPIIAGNITKNQPFWKKYIKKDYNLEITDYIDQNGFYFTNDPALTREDLNVIKELLK